MLIRTCTTFVDIIHAYDRIHRDAHLDLRSIYYSYDSVIEYLSYIILQTLLSRTTIVFTPRYEENYKLF